MPTHSDFLAVHQKALDAGYAAQDAIRAQTFIVQQRQNPLDDNSPVVEEWTNGGGGFEAEGSASIRVNGNSGYGRWLKKNGRRLTIEQRDHYGGNRWLRPLGARKYEYAGGVGFGAPVRGYERSIAFAQAYVGVVQDSFPTAKPTYTSFID